MSHNVLDRPETVDASWAARTARDALAARGVPEGDAMAVADALIETSRLGVHTHGLRLLATYLDELDRGVATAAPAPSIVSDRGPAVLLDADNALGIVAGLRAVALAVERARRQGIAMIGVRRSNHFGAAGVYSRRIAACGLLGVATTSAASRVAPFGGADPLLGTNPISIAFGDELCLDMATSQVCFSEIRERARTGDPLSPDWAVGTAGQAVADPAAAHALTPLGGYKGQGLAMAVTVLTAVLMGGPLDFELEHMHESADGRGRRVCHTFIAIDPEAFGGAEQASGSCGRLLSTVREARRADPARAVQVPGDPQRRHRERHPSRELELDAATRALLNELATSHVAT